MTGTYFEVRLAGDEEIEFLAEPTEDPNTGEINYNELDSVSAIKHANKVGGYVVKITVEELTQDNM